MSLCFLSFYCLADLKQEALKQVQIAFWKYDISPMIGFLGYFSESNRNAYLKLTTKKITEICRLHIKKMNDVCSSSQYVYKYPRYCKRESLIWIPERSDFIESPGFPLTDACMTFFRVWDINAIVSIPEDKKKLLTKLKDEAKRMGNKFSTQITIFDGKFWTSIDIGDKDDLFLYK